MALSYNRKSNSSASSAASTFRRAGKTPVKRPASQSSTSMRPRSSSKGLRTPSNPRPSVKPASGRRVPSKATGTVRSTGSKRPSVARLPSSVVHPSNAAPVRKSFTASKQKAFTPRAGNASKPSVNPLRPGVVPAAHRPAARKPASGPGAGAGIFFGAIGVVLALLVVVVIVVNSGLFAASDIQIKGSEHMTEADARRLIDIPDGTSLFNVDENKIAENLKQNPWISGVKVERSFPHTLVITPTEYKVSAIVYLAADDLAWAVSGNKTWIAPVSLLSSDSSGTVEDRSTTGSTDASQQTDSTSDAGTDASTDGDAASDATAIDVTSDSSGDASTTNDATAQASSSTEAAQALAQHYGAVLIVDVPSDISPVSGERVTSRVVNAGLEYATGFSSDFAKQIKSISVPSAEAVSVNLTSGVEVSLGSASDVQRKEKIVTRLLNQEQGVTYINVRTPGSYTFRSAPTS